VFLKIKNDPDMGYISKTQSRIWVYI